MALFCDFENVALGVRDAKYEKFDIKLVLERLLLKGSIVVKKAYCDWDRYKGFKATMHEANFELIEIPHVRQSGKNSADIRLVVDALDLCYTKSHVNTFVIISGDSDFSPLVSKLRENAKKVIGVGVKQSCSDLLITNCDEFIYYDDLVRDREAERAAQRREREKRSPEEEARRREKQEERKAKAVGIVSATFVDLMADRGDSERIWASVLKEVVKRRNPGFNESYYGFRTFGNLLEEAAHCGLLGFGRDDKGAFVFRAPGRPVAVEAEAMLESATEPAVALVQPAAEFEVAGAGETAVVELEAPTGGRRRGGRRTRIGKERSAPETAAVETPLAEPEAPPAATVEDRTPAPAEAAIAAEVVEPAAEMPPVTEAKPRRTARRPRKAAEPKGNEAPAVEAVIAEAAPAAVAEAEAKKPAKARRPARPRKPKTTEPVGDN